MRAVNKLAAPFTFTRAHVFVDVNFDSIIGYLKRQLVVARVPTPSQPLTNSSKVEQFSAILRGEAGCVHAAFRPAVDVPRSL